MYDLCNKGIIFFNKNFFLLSLRWLPLVQLKKFCNFFDMSEMNLFLSSHNAEGQTQTNAMMSVDYQSLIYSSHLLYIRSSLISSLIKPRQATK